MEKYFPKIEQTPFERNSLKIKQTLFQRNSLIKQTLFKNTRGFLSLNGKKRGEMKLKSLRKIHFTLISTSSHFLSLEFHNIKPDFLEDTRGFHSKNGKRRVRKN